MNENTTFNWYPGHIAKTRKEIEKIIPLVDFVLELIDSRIPNSSKIIDSDTITKNKTKILVFTKYDLCDKLETDKWVTAYQNEGYKTLVVNLKDKEDIKSLKREIKNINLKLNQERLKKGLKPKEIKGFIFGVPNVGKSTLINALAGKKVTPVANTPGFTKSLSWIKINDVLLLDTPGILCFSFKTNEMALNLASMGSIKLEITPLYEVANHIIEKLKTHYQDILMNYFNIEDIDDSFDNICLQIGNKFNLLSKGGDIDEEKIYLFIINTIKTEKLKGITFDRYEK